MDIHLIVNGASHDVVVEKDMPLLWVIRDFIGKKGTKFGCGRGVCGACSIIVDGELFRSCTYPAHLAQDKNILTIEGLSAAETALHPIQQAWYEENVVQCGYCQPGFIIAAFDLLSQTPYPTDEEIKMRINNLCRCGTYPRIFKAIKRAAILMQNNPDVG